jgi:hypothetical protein
MPQPTLQARAYRSDLRPEGVPGQLGLEDDLVVFEGNGLCFELAVSSLAARVGGLDERFLFLQSTALPGLEIAIDRRDIEPAQPLLLLPPVARALETGRWRRRRFWGCALALAAVLAIFALMILILFSLVARAAFGAPSPGPWVPEARPAAQERVSEDRFRPVPYPVPAAASPKSASERRASRP